VPDLRGSSWVSAAAERRLAEKTGDMSTRSIRWVGVAIDCADAGPVARFYEHLLGFEVGDFEPPQWAQLRDPAGGVALNIQGETWYRQPFWPEQPGEQTKMLHLEVEVDDVRAAVARASEAGGTEAPWQPPDRDPARIRIVLDPAGHPLCLFVHGE
jgi:catechol 2,3-dioxygenase-like lactoylglutathione lyase family enzyme